eukprot:1874923-Pyramimonas_sp.AAC.1
MVTSRCPTHWNCLAPAARILRRRGTATPAFERLAQRLAADLPEGIAIAAGVQPPPDERTNAAPIPRPPVEYVCRAGQQHAD